MHGKQQVLAMVAILFVLLATVVASAIPITDVTKVTAPITGSIAEFSSTGDDCSGATGRPGAFYMTAEEDFRGRPYYWGRKGNQTCYPFDGMDFIPRSIGPDAGGHCEIYLGWYCQGPALAIKLDGGREAM